MSSPGPPLNGAEVVTLWNMVCSTVVRNEASNLTAVSWV
jgi:hypothetical protein